MLELAEYDPREDAHAAGAPEAGSLARCVGGDYADAGKVEGCVPKHMEPHVKYFPQWICRETDLLAFNGLRNELHFVEGNTIDDRFHTQVYPLDRTGGATTEEAVRRSGSPALAAVINALCGGFHMEMVRMSVNLYRGGTCDSIHFHRDNFGRNGGKHINLAVSASFGAPRWQCFRWYAGMMRPPPGTPAPTCGGVALRIRLNNGDVFAFDGRANDASVHRIEAAPAKGDRIAVIIWGLGDLSAPGPTGPPLQLSEAIQVGEGGEDDNLSLNELFRRLEEVEATKAGNTRLPSKESDDDGSQPSWANQRSATRDTRQPSKASSNASSFYTRGLAMSTIATMAMEDPNERMKLAEGEDPDFYDFTLEQPLKEELAEMVGGGTKKSKSSAMRRSTAGLVGHEAQDMLRLMRHDQADQRHRRAFVTTKTPCGAEGKWRPGSAAKE